MYGLLIARVMMIGAMFIFLESQKSRGNRHICLGVITIGLVILAYFQGKDDFFFMTALPGKGFYVVLLGGFLIIISGVLLKKWKKERSVSKE